MNKKGQGVLDTLGGIFITIAVVAVAAVLMFLMIAEGQSQIVDTQGIDTTNATTLAATRTAAYNGTQDIQVAAAGSIQWVGLAVTIMIMVALLSLIMLLKNKAR